MGAFCVFGVSRSACRLLAEKKTPTFEGDGINRRELTMQEWSLRRDALAKTLFETTARPFRVSPEFDAPQFCKDWISVAPAEVKQATVMVRGPKLDGGGKPIKRNGVPLMTWVEFSNIKQFSGVANEA
ncbi:hypothetical protein HSX11_01605 [Oxalobacteraceae bacterium]|nr:hypothetical protein [Oxalobacteraceae bacterium]